MFGLILPATMKFSPFVQYYIKTFRAEGIPFEVLSWDKNGFHEPVDHAFSYATRDSQKLRKAVGYWKYRNWVISLCKEKKYEKLIIFTLVPAILLSGFLEKYYAGRYYLDIRDDTALRRYLPRRLAKVIRGAAGIVSSSREFEGWIGQRTTMCHNVDAGTLSAALQAGTAPVSAPGETHRIMFAGMLNEWQINLELVSRMANRPGIRFVFHAPQSQGKQAVMDYCAENGVENTAFFGPYQKEEIHRIYRNEADWANIIRRESTVNRNALPNKLYDAMVAGVPVIVLGHNKAVADYVRDYGLGLIFDSVEDLERTFFEKAAAFDRARFATGRRSFLETVQQECSTFYQTVISWNEG